MPSNRISRRRMLASSSTGFGTVALAGLLADLSHGGDALPASAAMRATHHPARAKSVIFCFMSGGVSHIDSFDPKPRLQRDHGKPMPVKVERTQFNNNGNIMASPFKYTPAGESGIPVSSMFPRIATVVDELALIRSMTTPVNEHAQGNFFMHSGFPFMGYPSAGAWIAYGLGTESQELPGYVVLHSGDASPPHGGVGLFSNGFLPAYHQGSIVKIDRPEPLPNLRSPDLPRDQRRRIDYINRIDRLFLETTENDSQVEAAIQNLEIASKMQTAVPELCDLSGESAMTRQMYGLESPDEQLSAYGQQCLLARRLVERGVRFVEVSCLPQTPGGGQAANPWDQHGGLEIGHTAMARQVDQPIAALITDLRQRGMLDETLVVWAGEFGRTPFSQGTDGRDHNPFAFSVWFAGGGVKGGSIYGATDEFGYHTIADKCTVYDMWATVLHQLGVNHEKLTYRYGGRDVRLTDVHGNVLDQVLA